MEKGVLTSFLDGFALAGLFTRLRRVGAPTCAFAPSQSRGMMAIPGGDELGTANASREEKIRAREEKLRIDAENAHMAKFYREHVLGEKPVDGLVDMDQIKPVKPVSQMEAMKAR